MSPAPRAMEPYFAWESILTLFRVTPSFLAIADRSLCDEWPASTLSQNVACEISLTVLIWIGWLFPSPAVPSGRLVAP